MNVFILAILSIPLAGCSIFGRSSVEELNYEVIDKSNIFEVRTYKPYLKAEVTIDSPNGQGQSDAFRILAGYIFGKNKTKSQIKMTSPVLVDEKSSKSENIAMTAPVMVEENVSTTTMFFSMPSKYKETEDLPTPNDKRIKLIKTKEIMMAALSFSGRLVRSNIDPQKDKLKSAIDNSSKYNIATGSKVLYAGYNPPWTLPFLRRNEVLVPVDFSKTKKTLSNH